MSELTQGITVVGAVVGVFLAYIAWRQWETAKDKIKLEMSVDRWKAYQQLKDAVAPVTASGKVRNEDCDAFAKAMQDMQFLFDREIEKEVKEIYHAMLQKYALDAVLDRNADKQKALLKSSELFARITRGVYTDIPKRMEKLMRLRSGS